MDFVGTVIAHLTLFADGYPMSLRLKFAPRIARILSHYTQDSAARRKALRLAYPMAPPWQGGPPYPYQIWRDEIARQNGKKPPVQPKKRSNMCAYTLELFAQHLCPHTLDLFR